MKRTERHHLKENELQTLARDARERFEAKRRETTAIIGIVAVVGAIAVGYLAWRERGSRGCGSSTSASARRRRSPNSRPPPTPTPQPTPACTRGTRRRPRGWR